MYQCALKMCRMRLLMHGQEKCSRSRMSVGHEHPAGMLPAAWRLPALQTLEVSGNGLTGTLPASWHSGLPNINKLKLKFNKLRCVLFWCQGARLLHASAWWIACWSRNNGVAGLLPAKLTVLRVGIKRAENM